MFRRRDTGKPGTNGQPIRRKVVPGALGIGKVEMVFKEKPKKKSKILAIFLYLSFFSLVYFSFGWSREYLKEKQLIPTVRAFFQLLDSLKLDYFTQTKTDLSSFRIPHSKAIVQRTELGAKISAPELVDTVFAQGYLHAVDRLFQMEVYRRAAKGRLSELFGNQTIDQDKFARVMQFSQTAKLDMEQLDQKSLKLLEVYVEGINSYLTSESSLALPLDFQLSHGLFASVSIEKWTIHDCMSILRLLSYEWSGAVWEDQLLRYLGEILTNTAVHSLFQSTKLRNTPKDQSRSLDGISLFPGFAGTTIAVGSKYARGSLLGSDFYSTNHQQGFWYVNSLEAGDVNLNVEGFSFPGIPFLVIGKNPYLSWTFNADRCSDQDQLFHDKNQFRHLMLSTRSELIQVYSSPPLEFSWVETENCRDILSTVDSATFSVLSTNRDKHLFLCSSSFQVSNSFQLLSQLTLASNAEELEQVVDRDTGLMNYLTLYFSLNNGTVGLSGRKTAEFDICSSDSLPQPVRPVDKVENLLNWKPNPRESFNMMTEGIIVASNYRNHDRILHLLFNDTSDAENESNGNQFCSVNITSQTLQHLLKDDSSPSSIRLATFMIYLIDQLSAAQEILQKASSEIDLQKFGELKRQLLEFQGSHSFNNEALTYMTSFQYHFLLAVLKPLVPLEDVFLGTNVSAILRKTFRDDFRVGIDSFVDVSLLVAPNASSIKISSVMKNNYWNDQLLSLHPIRSSASSLFSLLPEEEDIRDYHYLILFASLLSKTTEWADSQYPINFFNPKRSWRNVHTYQNAHAMSKTFEVFDTMIQRGPLKKLTGQIDSIMHADATLTKFKFYSKGALSCDSCFIPSIRMIVDMSDKNRTDEFSLPVKASNRLGSRYFGWNNNFF